MESNLNKSNKLTSNQLLQRLTSILKNTEVASSIMQDIKTSVDRYNFDLEKISEKLLAVLDKYDSFTNVRALLLKVINATYNSTERTEYEKKYRRPAFTSLHDGLKKANITGSTEDLFLIDAIEEHCLNEFPIELDELVWTNRAIVEYCKTNNLTDFKDFIDLLLKSKLLSRCNVPMDILRIKVKESAEQYDKIMKELEEF